MTETNFRYSVMLLLAGHGDAQIIVESKIEYLRNLSATLGIKFEALLADEFRKLWVERSACNVKPVKMLNGRWRVGVCDG